jgi:hypothetical protein
MSRVKYRFAAEHKSRFETILTEDYEMPDVFTKEKRSDVMSRIRSRGNKKTELALMRVFKENHIVGWRRHVMVRSSGSQVQSSENAARTEIEVQESSVVREEGEGYKAATTRVKVASQIRSGVGVPERRHSLARGETPRNHRSSPNTIGRSGRSARNLRHALDAPWVTNAASRAPAGAQNQNHRLPPKQVRDHRRRP